MEQKGKTGETRQGGNRMQGMRKKKKVVKGKRRQIENKRIVKERKGLLGKEIKCGIE